jgi:hypothetical protein
MSRSSGRACDVATWLAICSLIAVIGCAKNLSPPTRENRLPDGLINDTLDFQKKIAPYSVSVPPHVRKRKAKCFLSLCSRIDVSIQAMGNTVAIDPNEGPTSGLPVAHLVNLDKKKTERFFGLLPGAKADYYLWVDRKHNSKHAQWTLVQVSHTENSVIAAEPADLNRCHAYTTSMRAVPDADFTEYKYDGPCTVPLPREEAKVSQASLFPLPVLGALLVHVATFLDTALRSDGGWIECSNGCCT